jgi:hypothetical protein
MLAALTPGPAGAQSCETGPGEVLETFPASGSRDVPRNGLVEVRYCPSDEPLVDFNAVRLLRDAGRAEAGCTCPFGMECQQVSGEDRCLEEALVTRHVEGGVVRLETAVTLAPVATYVIEAPEPAGVMRLTYATGSTIDSSPPEFDGLADVRILGCGSGYASDPACPANGDGFAVVLRAPAAIDGVGRVNLEYDAFQVRDEVEIERGTTRGDGTDDATMTVFVPTEELAGSEWERMCFAMTARDFYGHETPDEVTPADTVCDTTPEYSPFGSLCAVATGHGSADGWPASIALALVALFRRRTHVTA